MKNSLNFQRNTLKTTPLTPATHKHRNIIIERDKYLKHLKIQKSKYELLQKVTLFFFLGIFFLDFFFLSLLPLAVILSTMDGLLSNFLLSSIRYGFAMARFNILIYVILFVSVTVTLFLECITFFSLFLSLRLFFLAFLFHQPLFFPTSCS